MSITYDTLADRALVERIQKMCAARGWDVAVPNGQVIRGFVIGTKSYVDSVVQKVGWDRFAQVVEVQDEQGLSIASSGDIEVPSHESGPGAS